jgi:hypothetical protein
MSGSQQESEQQAEAESVNDSEAEPIQIDDDDDDAPEDTHFGTKRKLTSIVWNDFKKVKIAGELKARCLHCHR